MSEINNKILITDIFEDLKEENNRLLNELLLAQKLFQLFENYRNLMNETINNKIDAKYYGYIKYSFQLLEDKYSNLINNSPQTLSRPHFCGINNIKNITISDENDIYLKTYSKQNAIN